jgi:sugar-specific transcriptional regulator TrmB
MKEVEIVKNKQIYIALKELGLTEQEVNLYVISLELGPTSITEISKYLNISRPNVYKVIDALEKRGLASFTGTQKYARNFMVESPTVILDKLRDKRSSIEDLDNEMVHEMPSLLALYQQGSKDSKIKVIKGRDEYAKLFIQTADETEEGGVIEFFGSVADFVNLTGWDIDNKWVKMRLKKNISVKSLIPKESEMLLFKNQKEELREVRTYSGEMPFSTAFELFGKKMILWQPKAPMAILIEDEYLVEMLRSIFYTLWNKAGSS